MKFKIKRKDSVVVITGDCKGKRGNVIKVDRKKKLILIDGVNMTKHHQKRSQSNPDGQIENKEAFIDYSNVMSLSDFQTSVKNR